MALETRVATMESTPGDFGGLQLNANTFTNSIKSPQPKAINITNRMSPEELISTSPLVGQEGGSDHEHPEGSTTVDRTLPSDMKPATPRTNVKSPKNINCDSEMESFSDAEKFDGKIVYNPDGSAYIIEGDDDEVTPELPLKEGSIIAGDDDEKSLSYPQIANAFYVSRASSLYQALYGQAYMNFMQEKKLAPETPIVHSYRVFTLRDKSSESTESSDNSIRNSDLRNVEFSSEGKPILMCFICKLSFSYSKSFVTHATSDHSLKLNDEEMDTLNKKNVSAIMQCVGKEKQPILSFLEPVVQNSNSSPSLSKKQPVLSSGASSFASTNTTTDTVSSGGKSSTSPGATSTGKPDQLPLSTMVPSSLQSQFVMSQTSPGADSSSDMSIKPDPDSFSGQKSPDLNLHSNPYNMLPHNHFGGLDLTRKLAMSQSEAASRSLSPVSAGVGSLKTFHSPGMVAGTTIGACSEHMNGRPSGVPCTSCDLILSSSNSLNTHIPLMQSRNSCKTLKCPKCNWHYKYQETLEIHMREKHPDTETTCIYCITSQAHPRLARGESYTCGYKPYRCEVCNYSTTTKGNLSIHMQSDKHLNNIQELQSSGNMPNMESQNHQPNSIPTSQPPTSLSLPPPHSPLQHPHSSPQQQQPPPPQHSPHHHLPPAPSPNSTPKSNKPKPTWRCDVCNYETNVARNLRIHMTSEKHTHNMMVLQQNVKHMQQFQAMQAHAQAGMDATALLQLSLGGMQNHEKPPPHAEAALADMAYQQALLVQMMTSGQIPPHMNPEMNQQQQGENGGMPPEMMEQHPDALDPNPTFMYQCCICAIFSTDNLEALNYHLSQDRTKIREQEILRVVAGNYICQLCQYKTNLKANFQLHCKTDKHLQRLQHVNHIKEGGPQNEWRVKYLNLSNPIQVRCNACDFYTNSTHKLQLHIASQQHEVNSIVFWHLQKSEESVAESERMYHCNLCKFSNPSKMNLIKHIRTMTHLQMENLNQLKRRSEGKDMPADISEIFQVKAGSDKDEQDTDKGRF